jgi:hypothetical protein
VAPDSAPQPLTQVDADGNVWAWYGAGNWVLFRQGPGTLAGPTARQARVRERDDEHEKIERARPPAAPAQGRNQGMTSASVRQERPDDD